MLWILYEIPCIQTVTNNETIAAFIFYLHYHHDQAYQNKKGKTCREDTGHRISVQLVLLFLGALGHNW